MVLYVLRIARSTMYAWDMTKPTNILLDQSVRAVAKRRAEERGLSLSAYIRELIRSDDASIHTGSADITPLIGILGNQGEGTPTDIAHDKHDMIAQAYQEDFEKRQQARKNSVLSSPVRRHAQ